MTEVSLLSALGISAAAATLALLIDLVPAIWVARLLSRPGLKLRPLLVSCICSGMAPIPVAGMCPSQVPRPSRSNGRLTRDTTRSWMPAQMADRSISRISTT